jgi:hypothetical protein
MNARSLKFPPLYLVTSSEKPMSTPKKSTEEMISALYENLADPSRRPASASEVRGLRDQVDKNHAGLSATIEAHSQRDEQNFTTLGARLDGLTRTSNETAKRVDALERKPSPYPGTYSSVRSIIPPPGKPSDTGSWNVRPEYLEQIQDQITVLHNAREEAERNAALADARAKGAEDARREQAESVRKAKEAADEAEAIKEKVNNRQIRNLKLIMGVLALVGPLLAWCANEARHALTDTTQSEHVHSVEHAAIPDTHFTK